MRSRRDQSTVGPGNPKSSCARASWVSVASDSVATPETRPTAHHPTTGFVVWTVFKVRSATATAREAGRSSWRASAHVAVRPGFLLFLQFAACMCGPTVGALR
jgi:hypothetical protein